MNKRTTHNPIPSGTKTLHDILPESSHTTTPHGSKTTLKKRIIMKDGTR